MTTIEVYDIEAKKIKELADRNDTTEAEIVYLLMDYVGDMVEANNIKE